MLNECHLCNYCINRTCITASESSICGTYDLVSSPLVVTWLDEILELQDRESKCALQKVPVFKSTSETN